MAVRFLVDYIHAQMEAIARHKLFLSESAGNDVGWEQATRDFISRGFSQKFHDNYFKEHNITSLDSDVTQALNGDSCLILEFKAIAHNYETGVEAVLEEERIRYYFGKRENCPNRKEISQGLYSCQRKTD